MPDWYVRSDCPIWWRNHIGDRFLRVLSLGFVDYADYLASPDYLQRRRQVLDRAAGSCEACSALAPKLQVHHLHYYRLGAERPEDLTALCDDCHYQAHPNLEGHPSSGPSCARLGQHDVLPESCCRWIRELDGAPTGAVSY